MCTCLGMHAHECEWVYASVPVPGGQKRSSRVVICSCLPIPLRQGLFSEPGAGVFTARLGACKSQ